MANFLEYQPHLEYKRKLKAVLHNYQTNANTNTNANSNDPNAVNNGDADLPGSGLSLSMSPSQQLEEQLGSSGYVPNEAIKEAVDLTPTDTVMKFAKAKEKTAALIDKIVRNLEKVVTMSPNINDYIKARETNDADTVYEFEDFHSDHIEGHTQAEVLPVLFDLQEELDGLAKFVGEYAFPNELSQDLNYLTDQIDRLRTEEQEDIKYLIQQDINDELDEDVLKEKNHVLSFLHDRANTVDTFTDSVESVISVKPEAIYYDSGPQIAKLASKQSALSSEFAKLNQRRFMRECINAYDAAQRMARLADKEYKRKLLIEVTKLQKEKLESRQAISAIYAANPATESDPLNIFLMDMLEVIQETKETCDSLVEDLYKITELESLQNVDYLTSLEKKDTCRHMSRILGGLESMDKSSQNIDTEIEKLFRYI